MRAVQPPMARGLSYSTPRAVLHLLSCAVLTGACAVLCCADLR